MVPYFCFYTGTILVGQVKEAAVKQTGVKPSLIADYCQAMEDKAFLARKSLLDKTLNG